MSDCKNCLLGDILTFQRGHDLSKERMEKGEYPVVGSNGIIGYHSKYTTESPSITIGRSGNTGNPYIVYGRSWSHNTTLYVKEFKGSDPTYVYYLLKTLDLGSFAGGSAVPTLNRNHIHSLEISVPPLAQQIEIGRTLRMFDDKIANNTAINHHLEQIAQAVFKSWFVDFEAFSGVMPDNWREGTINEIAADIVCGKTPPARNREFFGNDLPFITIPDMHGRTYITTTERSLSKAGVASQSSKTVPANSICVSCIATAGLVVMTSKASQTNQQINTIVCRNGISPFYTYLAMVRMADYIKMLGSSGSTTNNLNKGQFSKIKILIPLERDLDEFNDLVSPIFEKIKRNQQESEYLINLRDALLPRLICGELSVTDLVAK